MKADSLTYAGGGLANLAVGIATGNEPSGPLNQLRLNNAGFLLLRNSSGTLIPHEYVNGPVVDPGLNSKSLRVPGRFRASGGPITSQQGVESSSALWNGTTGITEATDMPYTKITAGWVDSFRSIRFNGTSNNLYSSNAAVKSAITFGSAPFTISLWVKADQVTNSFRILECDGGQNIAYSSWLLWRNAARAGWTFEVSFNNTQFNISTNFGVATAGVWTLITIVRDTENNWNFFQNGIFQTKTTIAGSIYNGNLGLAIGHMFIGTWGGTNISARMTGNIADIQIYKGYASNLNNFAVRPVPFFT